MTTYTTITVTIKGQTKPTFKHQQNRRMTETQVHKVVKEGLIGLDPKNVDVNVFFETKDN